MTVRPQRFAPHTFVDQVQRSLFSIVRLELRSEEFHAGVAEYFEGRYPRLFTFGLLSRRDVRDKGFLSDAFQTALGPLRGGVKDGYHLFHAGLVIAHHPGTIRPPTAIFEDERTLAMQREQVMRFGFKGARVVPPGALEACRQIVFPLETLVERKQGAAGFAGGDAGPGAGAGDSTRWVTEEAESTTLARGPTDPFELLEVAADATDDEIKAAYKRAMKLNHPDKVAHMSKAIQEFARQQSLLVKKAYDAIVAMKRR